ncbi:DUF6065 family protein [Pseudomonas citronellolis]|uniref:DUF6065 family protein n=1 Tax=Pseudomonas citronellolis TaxID=53408 RepID=UPI000AB948FD|nr:DUF6065 family protein [Pseudomonas citronellolis]
MNISMQDDLEVVLWPVLPNLRPPQKADPSLMGTIPLRAFQYCRPFTLASGQGWYLYPPEDFQLIWDGAIIYLRLHVDEEWVPLEVVEPLGASEAYREHAPLEYADLYPPLMMSLPEPGVVQITTGFACRSPQGIVMSVRAPVNLPTSNAIQYFEGIIETDWWHGTLLSVIRITEINKVITFSKSFPLFQAIPVSRNLCSIGGYSGGATKIVEEFSAVPSMLWELYKGAAKSSVGSSIGKYAKASRALEGELKRMHSKGAE